MDLKTLVSDSRGIAEVLSKDSSVVTHSAYVASAQAYLRKCADQIEKLQAVLVKSKRAHYYCEDPWYSCPKALDGCLDESAGKDCNCGADEFNAEIDAAMETQAASAAVI